MNSEKTIFMKCDGKEFIMHGIFVDDMKHVPTAKYLLDEFLEKYYRDIEITGDSDETSPYGEFYWARCRTISEQDISPS